MKSVVWFFIFLKKSLPRCARAFFLLNLLLWCLGCGAASFAQEQPAAPTDVARTPRENESPGAVPMTLTLKADKEAFYTGEPILFEVGLKNTSRQTWRVKDLTNQTMYCLYDQEPWGAQQIGGADFDSVPLIELPPGQALVKKFLGAAFPQPREVEIFCSYSLTFKGVNPQNVLRIKIVPKPG
ncbi:MAG: hypothetical protein HQL23_06660 [Candidatus Omnitrophica bacterium]|nr:hypothetical protein [Candidatus Omnitrophota bacterium]